MRNLMKGEVYWSDTHGCEIIIESIYPFLYRYIDTGELGCLGYMEMELFLNKYCKFIRSNKSIQFKSLYEKLSQ